ncbi:hypothetical protein MKW92_036005 [Papaver armeniacum]|nr:hypothetical protein MKW92_036005 [Papaver armeniacum]
MPKRVLVYFLKKLDSRLDNLDEVFSFFGRTPLHIAVLSNDIKFAKKILYLKPDLASKPDKRGWTPLHLASARASLEMVELLLMARPDVCKVPDDDQRTPLHLAVMNNRVEIMEVLTEEGRHILETLLLKNDQNGETILHFCVKNNCSIETLDLLADKFDIARDSNSSIIINSQDYNGKTVLQLAAESGKIEMVQYLLESRNLKREITDADFNEALNALTPKNTNKLQAMFLKYVGHSKKHKSNTFFRKVDKLKGQKERVNALLVVATLIAGIAFQAAMNPPGGVWQEDSKVDSGAEPVKFGFYLNQMFSSTMSGGLKEYLIRYSGGKQYSNVQNFVGSLMSNYSSVSSMAHDGLILEDSALTEVVSNYNSSDGNGGNFFPYLIRYAGYPVLGYIYPDIYMNYMVANGVALFMSLTIILLVICGFLIQMPVAQVRVLVFLMCISIGCIASAYLSVLATTLPDFYSEPRHTFIKVQVFFGVCCILAVGSFIWSLVWKIDKLRKRKRHQHVGFINYLREIFHIMDAKDAGKLILFLVSYFGFRLHGFLCYGVWSYIDHFWY